MMRKSTEEEKKLWAIVRPYCKKKSSGLVEDAPKEVIEAFNRLKKIDEDCTMQECGIDQ